MSDSSAEASPRFKEKMETLVLELIDQGILFSEAVDQFERCFIGEFLKRTEGNHLKAAAALGMHRNTLARKIVRHKSNKPHLKSAGRNRA